MGTDKLVSLYSVYKSSLWAAIGMVNRRFWLAMHAAPVSSLLFANEIVSGQMSTLSVPWHHTQGRHPGITVTMKPFTGADHSCRGCHIPTVSHCLTESWSQLLKNRGYTYTGFRLGVANVWVWASLRDIFSWGRCEHWTRDACEQLCYETHA